MLVDPNIGLLPQVPIFGGGRAGAACSCWRGARRAAWRAPGVVAAAASAAWLAFVAATATNVNHGGTPGLSRYATWFIPLAIPLFQEIDRVIGPPRRLDGAAGRGVCRARQCGPSTRRGRRRSIGPTRLASFLWTRHPSFDNPLPEIFAERLRGLDENWLPVATPGCEKVLLPGRGGRDSVWPIPCAPVTAARAMPGSRAPPATRTARRRGTSSSARACPRRRRSASIAQRTWPALGRALRGRRARVARVVEHARAAGRRSGCRHPVVAPRRPRRHVAGGKPVLRVRDRRRGPTPSWWRRSPRR